MAQINRAQLLIRSDVLTRAELAQVLRDAIDEWECHNEDTALDVSDYFVIDDMEPEEV